MKILITAFEPFGGELINPAQEAVKRMASHISGATIVKLGVPTVFYRSIDTVVEAVKRENPDVILCIGQAGGRFDITPERVAINRDDARIPDNDGNQPIDQPIYQDGENAYFSNLPIKAIVETLQSAGLPASVSNTAGTYVCNHLMYGVLYHLAKMGLNSRAGFIHVPYIPEQVVHKPVSLPSLALGDIVRGLEYAVEAIVRYRDDIQAVGGKNH